MFVGEAIYKGFLYEITKSPLVTRIEHLSDRSDPSCLFAIAHTTDGGKHVVGQQQDASYRCFPLDQCKLTPGISALEAVYANVGM